MNRYRPPQAKSSPYITEDGFKMLQAELKTLWGKRGDVTKALTAAAAEGDRSENAEYIYRKKELREIDRRIRYLQTRLPDLNIVPAQQQEMKQIFFGAWVNVKIFSADRATNHIATYRIVGPDVLRTREGLVLHLATSAINASADDGQSWIVVY